MPSEVATPYGTPGLRVDTAGGVLTLTLNRPRARNALDRALCRALDTVLAATPQDPDVRVVLLQGSGDGFSAGIEAASSEERDAVQATVRQCAQRMRALPQPVVASVHGFCLGEALALPAACDIVYAADRTTFDGSEAQRAGLVTRSLPAADLQREVSALAAELAAKDALALRFTKETLQMVGGIAWDKVIDFQAARLAELKALQAGMPSTRAAMVESFLAGKTKPGLAR